MVLGPVEQGQLKLRHAGQQIGVIVPLAHLGGHVGADVRDARVARMLFVGNEQVKLGVFLDLNTQLIQTLDGRIAGKEVLRARTEGDDLQVAHAQNRAGNRHKLGHFVRDLFGSADGILRNVTFQMAHAEVVGAVQHTAVRISAAIDHIAVALGCRYEHAGAVEVLGNQRFGGLGAEVAQKHSQCIAACGGDFGHSFLHVVLVLDSGLALVEVSALGGAGGSNGGAALLAQRDGKTVTADGDDAQLDLGDVGRFHDGFLPFM